MTVATTLFGDFMQHNNLRFGVESAGVKTVTKTREYTPHFESSEIVRRVVDKDKAAHQSEVHRNMRRRGFTGEDVAHPALKLSPKEYIDLRRSYSELNKDEFDLIISNAINARARLESRE